MRIEGFMGGIMCKNMPLNLVSVFSEPNHRGQTGIVSKN
jgi:hypothetical protein